MFTNEEKQILLELIVNEQTKYLLPKNEYESDKYKNLEALKIKIKEV